MSRVVAPQEPGENTEWIIARASGFLRDWLHDLEQTGNGLLRICHPRRIEQAFSRYVRGQKTQPALRKSLSGCSPADLTAAAHLLHTRAATFTPSHDAEARVKAELLSFADNLQSLFPEAPSTGTAPPGTAAIPPLDRHTMRPTELLWHTAAALQEAKTIHAVARALVEGAVALCDARSAVWWTQEERQLTATLATGFPLPPEGLRFSSTKRFWEKKALYDSVVVVELTPSLSEHAALLIHLEAAHGVMVRLRLGHRWIGALSVQDGDFDPERLDLLATIAQQGVASLHAVELEQAREQTDYGPHEVSSDVESVLTSAATEEELLRRVCTLTRQVASAEGCLIFLTEESDHLQLRAHSGLDQDTLASLRDSLTALVAQMDFHSPGSVVWWNKTKLRKAGYAKLLEAGFSSLLAVSLNLRAQLLGVIVLLSHRASAFQPPLRQEVISFFSQATSALEHMQLFESAQRRLTEMSDLTWVSKRVATTLDPESIAQTVTRAAADVLGVPRVALFRADEEGQFYPLPKGQVGFSDGKTQRLPATGHIGAEALETKTLHAINDVTREQSADDPLVVWMEAQSLLCAPMIAPPELRGLFVVADDVPRLYSLHMKTLLTQYANQAALAFQNAMLYQNAIQHVRRLSKLSELSEALATVQEPHKTAEITLQAAGELFDSPVGLLWLYEPTVNELALVAVRGLYPGEWAMQRLRLGEGLAGRAAACGKPLVSVDVTRAGWFSYRRQARQKGLGAAIAAPLIARGRMVGVLNLYRKFPVQFTDDDKRLLMSLANIAAVIFVNANLTKEAQQRNEFVTAMMSEVNHRMRNSLQQVAGLIRLELDRPQARSTEEVVRRAISYVQAVAAVHEVIREQDIPLVDMKEAAVRVVRTAQRMLRDPSIDIQVTGTRVLLPSQRAISIALVLNELIDNAVRHGVAGRPDGRVIVSLTEVGREVVLQVHDNGVGLPEGASLNELRGLGLQIVEGIIAQELNGTVTFESKDGFTVWARFPK